MSIVSHKMWLQVCTINHNHYDLYDWTRRHFIESGMFIVGDAHKHFNHVFIFIKGIANAHTVWYSGMRIIYCWTQTSLRISQLTLSTRNWTLYMIDALIWLILFYMSTGHSLSVFATKYIRTYVTLRVNTNRFLLNVLAIVDCGM